MEIKRIEIVFLIFYLRIGFIYTNAKYLQNYLIILYHIFFILNQFYRNLTQGGREKALRQFNKEVTLIMSPSARSELAGVGEGVARKAIQAARLMMRSFGFVDGIEFEQRRKDVNYITTGSKILMIFGEEEWSRALSLKRMELWKREVCGQGYACFVFQ